MAEYIEREALIRDLIDRRNFYPAIVKRAIEEAPTADVKEVERGEWRGELVKRCDWRGKKQSYYQPNSCSVCHEPQAERTNYCPNCGAKMRGDA